VAEQSKQGNQGPGFDGDSAELLDRAAAGDQDALDELFSKYLPVLRAFLRLRMSPALRVKESCSDLAQSTCREVLEHLDRFDHRGEAGFRQWLFTTAWRKVAKKYRYYGRDKRDVGLEQPAAAASDGGDEQLAQVYQTLSTPSRQLMRNEQIERLEAAFERLPEHYREVITLSRVVGLSHKEVAASMGRTEGATRVLLHRALGELADVLEM
jgi:RNA polymerase sigma-70 factor (ECF subfamily)